MARVVSPTGFSSAPVSLPTDFYREEFTQAPRMPRGAARVLLGTRHHRCRPGAGAGPRPARTALRERRCRSVDRAAASQVQRRDRPLRLVGSLAASLTELRSHSLRILRAAIGAVDPSKLLLGAHAAGAFEPIQSRSVVLISAGKAAAPMAHTAAGILRDRVMEAIVVTAGIRCPTRQACRPDAHRWSWHGRRGIGRCWFSCPVAHPRCWRARGRNHARGQSRGDPRR